MSINYDIIRKGLYYWAKNATGVEAIWMDQGERRIPKPYIGLNFLSPYTGLGEAEIRVNNDGKIETFSTTEITISVNVYGADAFGIASKLQEYGDFPSVQAALAGFGLVFVECGATRNLSQVMDTTFETRAQMDVRFRLCNIGKDPSLLPSTIEHVELNSEMTGSDSSQTIDTEIDIP